MVQQGRTQWRLRRRPHVGQEELPRTIAIPVQGRTPPIRRRPRALPRHLAQPERGRWCRLRGRSKVTATSCCRHAVSDSCRPLSAPGSGCSRLDLCQGRDQRRSIQRVGTQFGVRFGGKERAEMPVKLGPLLRIVSQNAGQHLPQPLDGPPLVGLQRPRHPPPILDVDRPAVLGLQPCEERFQG